MGSGGISVNFGLPQDISHFVSVSRANINRALLVLKKDSFSRVKPARRSPRGYLPGGPACSLEKMFPLSDAFGKLSRFASSANIAVEENICSEFDGLMKEIFPCVTPTLMA